MITTVESRLQELINLVDGVVSDGSEDVEDGLDYSEISYWILFGFIIFIAILSLILIIILVMMCSKNKCMNCKTTARVILVFLGLFAIILCILSLLILIGNVMISGFCGYLGEINKGNVAALYEF